MNALGYWLIGIVFAGLVIFMTDDFFFLSFSSLLIALPIFLIVEVGYIVVSYVAKREVRLVLSWLDFPTICFSIAVWGFVVTKKPIEFPFKSLANLIEPGIFTSVAGILYAIRCYHAFKGHSEMVKRWGLISAITIPLLAVLFAFLFPGLPE